MIEYTCDLCSSKLEKLFPDKIRFDLLPVGDMENQDNFYDLNFELKHYNHGKWEDGHICKKCLIKVVTGEYSYNKKVEA